MGMRGMRVQTDNSPSTSVSADSAGSNSATLAMQVQHLMIAAESVLRRAPEGLSELELIKALQQQPWQLLGEVDFADPARLYPVHFLLFHALYRLRDELARDGESLEISPLTLRLQPADAIAGTGLPDGPDRLREYYLDLSRYELGDDLIYRMMDDFWSGRAGPIPAADDLRRAAMELGFDDIPTELATVKQRFRRAVMQAHPDRGGSHDEIQKLNNAFSLFKAHFRNTPASA